METRRTVYVYEETVWTEGVVTETNYILTLEDLVRYYRNEYKLENDGELQEVSRRLMAEFTSVNAVSEAWAFLRDLPGMEGRVEVLETYWVKGLPAEYRTPFDKPAEVAEPPITDEPPVEDEPLYRVYYVEITPVHGIGFRAQWHVSEYAVPKRICIGDYDYRRTLVATCSTPEAAWSFVAEKPRMARVVRTLLEDFGSIMPTNTVLDEPPIEDAPAPAPARRAVKTKQPGVAGLNSVHRLMLFSFIIHNDRLLASARESLGNIVEYSLESTLENPNDPATVERLERAVKVQRVLINNWPAHRFPGLGVARLLGKSITLAILRDVIEWELELVQSILTAAIKENAELLIRVSTDDAYSLRNRMDIVQSLGDFTTILAATQE